MPQQQNWSVQSWSSELQLVSCRQAAAASSGGDSKALARKNTMWDVGLGALLSLQACEEDSDG